MKFSPRVLLLFVRLLPLKNLYQKQVAHPVSNASKKNRDLARSMDLFGVNVYIYMSHNVHVISCLYFWAYSYTTVANMS